MNHKHFHFIVSSFTLQEERLKLKNQLCFPLYVCSKEIIRRYKPFLDKIDLTYTQYITMMALWEKKEINVKELGRCLFLDSGTLTPVLKKLEMKKYITRNREKEDERNLIIKVTTNGMKLRNKVIDIPIKIGNCLNLNEREIIELYNITHKLLSNFSNN